MQPERRQRAEFRIFGEHRSEERRRLLQLVLVIIPFALLSVISVSVLMYSFTRPLRLAAPFSYDAPSFLAAPFAVCPGQTLNYHVALHINRAPTRITISRHWYNTATHQFAVPTTSAEQLIVAFLPSDLGPREGDRHVKVPGGLPPGSYAMREAAAEVGSSVAMMQVYFLVPKGCTL